MERKVVFGPVPSRRLGQSLGINNIPAPKICSYSCVYCQIGITLNYSTERREFYSVKKIVDEVSDILKKLKDKGEKVDFISFVPDGEPTLDINLGEEIEALRQFNIRIAVITNSSLLWKEDVRNDLKKADLVSLKIDTVNRKIWEKINRPVRGISIDKILEGIKKFSSVFNGVLLTETLLVKGMNDSADLIKETGLFILSIKPSTAYIGIPTRPPAEIWALPPIEKKVLYAYEIFTGYGIKTELITGSGSGIFGFTGEIEEDIVNTVSVHPMSKKQIEKLLKKANNNWNIMEKLLKKEVIKEIKYQGE
ncbi:MAG: radical SAM protein, partial [Candidatus Omnitrophica bacterium]|nr:radical SAM protein [Candidatus Omnitrophota bacterium]